MITIMLIFLVNITVANTMIYVGLWLPHFNIHTEKACTHECGFDAMYSARLPFSMKFFVVSMTFMNMTLTMNINHNPQP